jgi:hypothetical protein
MNEKDCGCCDYQGGLEQTRVECRVNGEWHKRGHRCEDFKEYVQSKNESERVSQAIEKRREKENRANEQSRREFDDKMAQKDREHATELQRMRMEFDKKQWRASWWWQIILFISGFVAGLILKP